MWTRSSRAYLAHAMARTEWPAAIAALLVCGLLAFGFWSAT